MPYISSYALQYQNVSMAALSASTYDLFITEGAPLPKAGSHPAITDAQVATLHAQGRTVVGYVDVGVTDTSRSYWNSAWTNNGDDLGTPTASAPAWLAGQPHNAFGAMVKFWDPAWQTIVINQAKDLVQRGYDGVFLDDTGIYYALGGGDVPTIRSLANQMATFVAAIAAAIRTINPNAYVVVNADPYLSTNVTADSAGQAAAQAYLNAVDAFLLENQSQTAIDYAQSSLSGRTILLLSLLHPGGATYTPPYVHADAWTKGVPFTVDGTSYNVAGTFEGPGTTGNDSLRGGNAPNQLLGLGGDDMLAGGPGGDVLNGGAGTDTASYADATAGVTVFLGGPQLNTGIAAGDSYISIENVAGSAYADVLGGLAGGTVDGGDGNDWLYGTAGVNTLLGGNGNDVLSGGAGADALDGGAGVDVTSYRNATAGVVLDLVTPGNSTGEAAGDSLSHIENLWGSDFNDTIRSNIPGGGQVYGFAGNDILVGSSGNDVFYGGTGADTITTGAGTDDLFFLSWNDHYNQYGTLEANEGGDTITDFTHGTDHIIVSRYWFGFGNIAGPAAALTGAYADFKTSGAATSTRPTFFWNAATGLLEFDPDGTGAGARMTLATLAGATLTLSDIWTA